MERIAVFVDAGYVFAQGGATLAGAKTSRTNLTLNIAAILSILKSIAGSKSSGARLLRIYWYDGAKLGPTAEQIALADAEDVKVRLGTINSAGQQKGVDSLLVTDLIDLARNQAISDALVVTGDGDLRIAVQIAQSFGVRIHLVGLEPCRGSQSRQLMQEADTTHEISKLDIGKFLSLVVPVQAAPPAALNSTTSPATSLLTQSIDAVLENLTPSELAILKSAIGSGRAIPLEYDRKFLGTCKRQFGRLLTDEERREARATFITKVIQTAP